MGNRNGTSGKTQERSDLQMVGAVRSEPGEIPTLAETNVRRESREAIAHRSQKPETPVMIAGIPCRTTPRRLAVGEFITSQGIA
jgi:hypothetical protein